MLLKAYTNNHIHDTDDYKTDINSDTNTETAHNEIHVGRNTDKCTHTQILSEPQLTYEAHANDTTRIPGPYDTTTTENDNNDTLNQYN